MKYFVFYIAVFWCTTFTFAQNDTIAESIKIKIPNTSLFHRDIVIEEVEIPLVTKTDSITELDPLINIKLDHWDTAVYNPYRNTLVQFPLQIEFTDSTFSSPVSHKKVITSRYGWRRGRPHQGIDIDLVTGDSVVSVLDGVVRFASYSGGHGKTVVVRHYNGLETTYAHLSHIAVKANDTITKGGYLGKGGNTGNSRGSHLHFVASFKGEYIHPEYLFDFSESNTIRAQELWVTREWAHARFHNSKRVSKVNVLTSKEAALASLKKEKKVYVVKKGDTLYGISRRNNLSISKICNTNAIKKSSPLKIGQKLVLEL
ncbi:M23 family metallopeptidase [uncultured Winogradskyella sp.]|uniref:M23 family metallopeptidase n=1 Tax=uncultured Winogradskyella sp. TaxID=395353 RepID=UPI002629E500|nr:M23 family metallopeptidase [uncultured Winogradskyella sp.]